MRLLVLCQWPLLLFVHNDCFGQTDANRLTYLDGCDPYDVHRDFPKLIARQWVGKPGVEAVVTLSIDDMMRPGPVPSPQSGVSMRKRFLTPLF